MSKLTDIFDFSKKEKNGILVLVAIIVVLTISNIIVAQLNLTQTTDSSAFEKEIAEFTKQQQFLSDSLKLAYDNKFQQKEEVDFLGVDKSIMQNELNPFPFNPNNLSEELWKKIGLTEKQIKSIKNYEAKGGKFYKKEDLKKMYSISEEEYSILEPYITIPQDTTRKWEKPKNLFAEQSVEINSADTFQLQKIPGIGESLARRIFKQREKLGGFYSLEQLKEVWGIDSSRLAKISKYFTIDKSKIKKININTIEAKELVKHPYLDFYMAKSIVVHRNKNGKYRSVTEIKNATLIYDELYNKLAPYLTTE